MSIKSPPAILGRKCRANFMGAWHFLVLSATRPPMPIKFLLLGGGFWTFLEGGGWKCRFCFYGRGDFLSLNRKFWGDSPLAYGIRNPPPQNTRLERRVLERKCAPSSNASVLGTPLFRTLIKVRGYLKHFWSLAAQRSHREIAITTEAASGLATIPLQKSQGFSLLSPERWRQTSSRPCRMGSSR